MCINAKDIIGLLIEILSPIKLSMYQKKGNKQKQDAKLGEDYVYECGIRWKKKNQQCPVISPGIARVS